MKNGRVAVSDKERVWIWHEMDVVYVGYMASPEGLSPYSLEKVWTCCC